MDFLFNSQNEDYKYPFGSTEIENTIKFKIKSKLNQKVRCELSLNINGVFSCIQMNLEASDNEYDVYAVEYITPETPCLIFYYFKIYFTDHFIYLGNNTDKLGGDAHVYFEKPVPFQITVVKKDIKVPNWYKEGVMYQIFVDRFYKGGEEDLYKDRKGFVKYTNWNDKNRYIKNSKGNIIYWDVYGGNIRGIKEKLLYLKDLGVSIIYLNPIFEANSNHKYDTADFEKIDPGFGSDIDFDEFISECNKNGIQVILDGVFSHVGNDSKYFNEFGNYETLGAYQSQNSPYYEWFRFHDYPDNYECWWKNLSLPNTEEMNLTYLQYILKSENSIVKKWIKRGIKGWRLDVADELPDEFIEILKTETKKQDPESIVMGEVWEDASNKESYGKLRKYFLGNELDSVMNYPFRDTFISYILGKIDGKLALRRLMSLYENYPKEYFYSCMNHVGTHDTVRILTIFGDAPTEYKIGDDEVFKYDLPPDNYNLGIKRMKLISFIQAIFPGVPCIYYGDEAGLQGFRDPYCRGTYPWGREDKELLGWYKKVFNFRKNSEILKKGKWYPYYCEGSIFSIIREFNGEKLLCIVNSSLDAKEITIPSNNAHDVLKNESYQTEMKLNELSCYMLRLD